MQFLDLSVSGFGKFHDLSVQFAPGINLIYGRNEAGKSTLHSFLRAMLFGLSRRPERGARQAGYERFAPWQEGNAYRGSLRFSYGGKIYRIERDFAKAPDDLRIVEEIDAARPVSEREISDPQALLREALKGLTETGYVNTISIGQLKAASDQGMIAELRRYIANLSTTGSIDLNAAEAVRYLEQKKKNYAQRLQPDAAKQYARAVSSIKNLEAELSVPENENRLGEYQSRREQMRSGFASVSEELRAVTEKIEKAQAVLSENQFTDEASVEKAQKDAEALYAAYQKQKAVCAKKWKPAAAVLALILGLLAVGGGACMPAFRNFLFPGFVLLLIAAALLLRLRSERRRQEQLSGQISELFQKQTGNATVDDGAMTLFSERMQGFVRLCRAVQEQQAEKDRLAKELLQLSDEQNACDRLIETQQQKLSFVEQKLQELNLSKNQAEEFHRITEENRRIKEEMDAISIAQERLQQLGAEIKNSIGTYLNREAGRLIGGITGGVYQSMDVGPDLDIRLNTRERMVPLGSVSSGTMDQIYLALRLAAVRLIEGNEDALPLLFDDSFVLYDDDRLAHALSFISKQYSGQMLIFTCHHREEKILTKNNTPYNMIWLEPETQHFAQLNKL